MIETGVGRTGVDQVREAQLANISLSLERGRIDDPHRRFVEADRVP